MSFFDLLKEVSKRYSQLIQDFILQFISDSDYEERDVNYYEKLIKRLDEDIIKLRKELREKERLRKEIEARLKEERKAYKERGYRNEYKYNYESRSYDGDIAKYYAMLELRKGAGVEEVKSAYRKLMKKYHPDFFSDDPEKQRIAKEVAQGLTRAYDELLKYLNHK